MATLFSHISVLEWSLLGAFFVVFVLQLYFYLRYMAAPARLLRRYHKQPSEDAPRPGCSVIVCARNEEHNLANYLQALLAQDYPLFEVIVVDDSSEDRTRAVIDHYMLKDKRVRTTFVPKNARVGSNKKLALTLGAKAAKYDYLLLTDADCRPESTQWIAEIMQAFSRHKADIVVGYGAYFQENRPVNRLIQFDTLFNGLHYLGAAICRHPYMGVGRNLAYRKDAFFACGGFSDLMNVRAGDDDLLVNKMATRRNTCAVCSPESITWSVPEQSLGAWLHQKRRHLSVSPHYRLATKIRLFCEPFARGLFYLLFIALLIVGGLRLAAGALLGWWLIGFALVLFLLRLLTQLLVINISAYKMGQRMFGLSLVWYDICLPLISLYMLATQPMYEHVEW